MLLQKCIRRFIAKQTCTKKIEMHVVAESIWQHIAFKHCGEQLSETESSVLQAHSRLVYAHRLFQTRPNIQSFARRCLVTSSNKNNDFVNEPLKRSASVLTMDMTLEK